MSPPTRRVPHALERFHAVRPWDHNAHFHRWILRQFPERVGSALDVGCGTGDLARLLAGRVQRVHAIDADPEITARARELTPAAAPVTYTASDALIGLGDQPYDVITCVAVVHHLPFTEALEAFRDPLTPGGLVIIGVVRERTSVDHLLGIASIPLNIVMALLKNRGRPAPRPVSMTARTVRRTWPSPRSCARPGPCCPAPACAAACSGAARWCGATADPRASQPAARNVRSRSELPTTKTDEKAMAAPAIIGVSRPEAASGRAATL